MRDAAHEASHALDFGIEDWSREEIHACIDERLRTVQLQTEVTARATEMLVCHALKLAYDVEKWAFVSFMEAIKRSRLELPRDLAAQITTTSQTKTCRGRAAQILRCSK